MSPRSGERLKAEARRRRGGGGNSRGGGGNSPRGGTTRLRRGDCALFVDLAVGMTNDDVLAQMGRMKGARESGWEHVVVAISGFDDDPREVREVPEVRAFCRRLATLGAISYLDFATSRGAPGAPEELHQALGALEVWLIGEGRFGYRAEIDRETYEAFETALTRANASADRHLGPLGPGGAA